MVVAAVLAATAFAPPPELLTRGICQTHRSSTDGVTLYAMVHVTMAQVTGATQEIVNIVQWYRERLNKDDKRGSRWQQELQSIGQQ